MPGDWFGKYADQNWFSDLFTAGQKVGWARLGVAISHQSYHIVTPAAI